MYLYIHVANLIISLHFSTKKSAMYKPDNIFVVHLREQLDLPSDAGHHLTAATDTDLLQSIETTIEVVTNLQQL